MKEPGDLHNGHGIVVKDGGDIFRGELVCRVAYEEASLADSTVTDYDASAIENDMLAVASLDLEYWGLQM